NGGSWLVVKMSVARSKGVRLSGVAAMASSPISQAPLDATLQTAATSLSANSLGAATGDFAMAQTPIDNTQTSLALTQAFVTSGIFPSPGGPAGGAFLDEIFTFAFNFSPSGTIGANGLVLPIATNTA